MARWLDAHPDVFVTKPKEVFFFSHERNYNKGWTHYLRLYDGAGSSIARGEATTDYCNIKMYPRSPERIARHIPDCRLIYMVRHPLDRIVSHWALSRSVGNTTLSLSRAIFELPQLIDASHYLKTMQAYLGYFSIEQIRVVIFEDFKSDPKGQAELCLKHIGVDPEQLPDKVLRAPNASSRLRRQSSVIRRLRKLKLMTFYRDVFPRSLRTKIRFLTTRERDWKIEWDQSSLLHIREALESDTHRFLELYSSMDSTCWRFDIV